MFTAEDFVRESKVEYDKLLGDSRSGNPELSFLNNLTMFLPIKDAAYRDMVEDAEEDGGRDSLKGWRKIIEFIDRYFEQKGWDFSNIDRYEVREKKMSELVELYCALRNAGFSHDEITT